MLQPNRLIYNLLNIYNYIKYKISPITKKYAQQDCFKNKHYLL